MTVRFGREFFKMTGSGNDFIFFDARHEPPGSLGDADQIRSLCARGTGVGADGVVFVERSTTADFAIQYFNSDGSRAALCGNASLCTVSLAVELGMGDPNGLAFGTDAGVLRARMRGQLPEIDLQPVPAVEPNVAIAREAGEQHLGFATVGVPHVVVLCDDANDVDLDRRGRRLRWDASFAQGANANFVSSDGDLWRMRTFERGVEGETLACGTGAVATALLLNSWGLAGDDVQIVTRSGCAVGVRIRQSSGSSWATSLRGEGRIVYRAQLAARQETTEGADPERDSSPVSPRPATT